MIYAEKPTAEKLDSPPSDYTPAPCEFKSCVVLKSLYTFPAHHIKSYGKNVAFAILLFSGMCP